MPNSHNKTIFTIVFSLQEAFISLFPYLLIRASCSLLIIINEYFDILSPVIFLSKVKILYDIFPLILCISISLHIAKNLSLHKLNFVLSSSFAFFLLSGFFHITSEGILLVPSNALVYAFIIPIFLALSILQIKSLRKWKIHFFSTRNTTLSAAIVYLPSYIFLFLFSFIIEKQNFLTENTLFTIFTKLSLEVQAVLHLLISHILWLFGIHGTTSYRYIFDMKFYTEAIFNNLPYENFFSAFIIFGGAGSTISLIIAILISKNDKHAQLIAKSSIPFSIFNINEIIIYGLPIALNKRYILPFLLVPLLNFILSLGFLNLGWLTFNNAIVPWTTPPLVSGYLLTNSIWGSIWQLLLIILGTYIYLPFCKKSLYVLDSIDTLRRKLSQNDTFTHRGRDFDTFKLHQQIEKDSKSIDAALQDIINGKLTIYYQPQINIADNTVYGFEALARLIKKDQVYPPMFLSSIEKAGLQTVFDLWVLKQIKKDMDIWHNKSIDKPLVSINLYPETLSHKENIDYIIEVFKGYRIKFEILERSFSVDIEEINSTLDYLISNGFEIAIDDFGSDQANLSRLGVIRANSIKLDQALLLHCENERGLQLFHSNCLTFKELGFHLVSEGVETPEQLEIVKKAGVDVAQGWLYSKALPLSSAIKYADANTLLYHSKNLEENR